MRLDDSWREPSREMHTYVKLRAQGESFRANPQTNLYARACVFLLRVPVFTNCGRASRATSVHEARV